MTVMTVPKSQMLRSSMNQRQRSGASLMLVMLDVGQGTAADADDAGGLGACGNRMLLVFVQNFAQNGKSGSAAAADDAGWFWVGGHGAPHLMLKMLLT